MQYTALLRELQYTRGQSFDTGKKELSHWVTILVRIAAGLNEQCCFRGNLYSIGISSLLTAPLLRCHL
jgi:hypothetical protein